MADFGEQFERPGGAIWREKESWEVRESWGFIGEGRRGEGIRVSGAGRWLSGQERNRAGAGLLPELDDDLTGGPHLSASGRGRNVPVWECARVGCGPLLGPGQNGAHSPFIFFCFFLYLFSDFLFLSKTFQNSSKTKSNQILICFKKSTQCFKIVRKLVFKMK
jgi:hypothetical protein